MLPFNILICNHIKMSGGNNNDQSQCPNWRMFCSPMCTCFWNAFLGQTYPSFIGKKCHVAVDWCHIKLHIRSTHKTLLCHGFNHDVLLTCSFHQDCCKLTLYKDQPHCCLWFWADPYHCWKSLKPVVGCQQFCSWIPCWRMYEMVMMIRSILISFLDIMSNVLF